MRRARRQPSPAGREQLTPGPAADAELPLAGFYLVDTDDRKPESVVYVHEDPNANCSEDADDDARAVKLTTPAQVRLAAWADESGVVGCDDRLDAVADAELSKHRGDMGL